MKCPSCGSDVPEGMKFCCECGNQLPQNKVCPQCNKEVPLAMKFCGYCGYNFAGASAGGAVAGGLSMGDKNVVAGDVIGSKEEYKVSGNATIIKNEDETKKVVRCHVCGKNTPIVNTHTCPVCGESVCDGCYDDVAGMCNSCKDNFIASGENEYREALRKVYEDGKVDLDERRWLDALQAKLGLSVSRASELENEIKFSNSGTENFTTMEKLKMEDAEKYFYENGDVAKAYELIKQVYDQHQYDEKVLNLYLPILGEYDSNQALDFIQNLKADMLTADLVKIDIYTKTDLSEAERILNSAESRWTGTFLLKCRKAVWLYSMYKETGREKFHNDFYNMLDSLEEPTTKAERKWKQKCLDIKLAEEAERQRIVEEKRKAQEAERQRIAEEKRIAEEAERKRKTEEEARRRAEEAERQRIVEEKRMAEEAERQRIVEEKRKTEEANIHPVILPSGTDGTAGTGWTYVLFGSWPQSIKAVDVSIDESKTYKVNGWECYKGSDGCYYVKAIAKPDEDVENPTFSNGESIIKGDCYYFKLENIKWRVLDNSYQGGRLLLSEKILDAKCFYHRWNEKRGSLFDRIYENNYEYSDIRHWLNSDFLTKAFSAEGQQNIKTVTVDNCLESTRDRKNKYVCNNTQDKVFLLSRREVTKESYGFDKCYRYIGDGRGTKTSSRIRKATDYSKAAGVFYNKCWWLRSPIDDCGFNARFVGRDGNDNCQDCVNHADKGVVVALSISF